MRGNDSNPAEALAATLPLREHPAGLSRRERLAFAVLDELAALQQQVSDYEEEHQSLRAELERVTAERDELQTAARRVAESVSVLWSEPLRRKLTDAEVECCRLIYGAMSQQEASDA